MLLPPYQATAALLESQGSVAARADQGGSQASQIRLVPNQQDSSAVRLFVQKRFQITEGTARPQCIAGRHGDLRGKRSGNDARGFLRSNEGAGDDPIGLEPNLLQSRHSLF